MRLESNLKSCLRSVHIIDMMRLNSTIMDNNSLDSLMKKTVDEAYALLEKIALNSYQWPMEKSISRKLVGLHEVGAFTNLVVK